MTLRQLLNLGALMDICEYNPRWRHQSVPVFMKKNKGRKI